MHLPRHTAPLAIVCLLSCLLVQVAAARDGAGAWIDRELSRYQNEQLSLKEREQLALQARQKAEAARQHATRINDTQALPIAERATATADLALQRLRSALARNAGRLAAVERARRNAAGGNLAVASSLQGTVEVRSPDGWQRLTPERLLRPGEEIRTGPDGAAEVLFDDGSRVNLHADSSFVLESEEADSSGYRLSLGRIKAQIERLGQRRYSIRTPTAVAGVRGTEFLLETTPDGASTLVVLRGEVAFGPAEQEARIAVLQGERAVLANDGTLRGPEPFDLKSLQPWWD